MLQFGSYERYFNERLVTNITTTNDITTVAIGRKRNFTLNRGLLWQAGEHAKGVQSEVRIFFE